MTTLVNTISNALNKPSSIAIEVQQQLEIARDSIGQYQAAQTLTNKMLHLMPRLVKEHVVMVKYKDDRDQEAEAPKDLNDIMWLIALQSTLESGHATHAGLIALYQQWSKEHVGAEWNEEAVAPIAKRFVDEMIAQHIIAKQTTIINLNGSPARVRKLTAMQQAEVNETIEELREAVPMKCKPLNNMPEDWTSSTNGIHADAGIELVTGNKHISVPSNVLNAVNKLQRVPFVIAESMLFVAKMANANRARMGINEEEGRMFAEILKYSGDTVYFPITMDKRGRMYYRGGLLSPQGTDFCKAAFQFANKKPLGEHGFNAIAIHTANVCGMDKVSLIERIDWVTANIDSGTFAQVKSFLDVQRLFPNADTHQATVAILEINRILATGMNPAEVESGLVCHQDGTCNGLQHMAAITGNRETAISVNCVASRADDTPSDIYGIIATEASAITTGEMKALIEKYGRSMAKNPVMIVGYGAGKETVKLNTVKYLLKKEGEEVANRYGFDIGEAYMQAIANKASAVADFTASLKDVMGQAIDKGMTRITWQTMDGFIAETEYTNIEEHRVRAGNFNAIKAHKDQILDDVKTKGAMAPNLVHSVDATHLRLVINQCDHELVTVHDSIGSHACDFFTTARSIREQFVAVHAYDAVGNLCDNVGVEAPMFLDKYMGTGYKAEEALESKYIFS